MKDGDKVGLGWMSSSCMSCEQCMDGQHHLCSKSEAIIVGRNGGFSDKVRGHWSWAIPLPDAIDISKAGALLCGGITVFNPIILAGVKPTDKVAVIGIGGLGHMALKFLKHWRCEVIAFSSNANKKEEILIMGASQVIDSTAPEELESITGTMLDFCVRHHIYPDVEEFPMEKVNEAIEHLENGKARFRIVLKNNYSQHLP
ncbi:D-arabinose 1-dehydrogenase, Zn-dependent alcohol dehydrogenase family [Kriegella aquimaris]|uniref:D-arabinose 1-dehydrogenase, Zn-dependent alcohol dehydrogenase family n=1 Tax=Kriegella aquimaris TaxID=192904 RepID=A0A1G9NWC2_9FLAO|nr:D-arabinose 1-dehydrogenase, Zn-dependent alcohol dehydrogenase family [Kriegella aquimaris]